MTVAPLAGVGKVIAEASARQDARLVIADIVAFC
jgi:hypothetical protein